MRSRAADVEDGFDAAVDDLDATSVAKLRVVDLAQFMDALHEGPAMERRSIEDGVKFMVRRRWEIGRAHV